MSAIPGASWSVNTTSSSARRSASSRDGSTARPRRRAARPVARHDDPAAAVGSHLHLQAPERRRWPRPRRDETLRRAARGRPPRRLARDGAYASPVRPAPAPRGRPRPPPRRTRRTRASRGPRRPARSASSSRPRTGAADHLHGLGLDPRGRRRCRVDTRLRVLTVAGRMGARGSRPSSSTACGSTGSTASSDSRTPFGLPGRFTDQRGPRAPATARESAAIGVWRSPAARISSASPAPRGRSRRASPRASRLADRSRCRRSYTTSPLRPGELAERLLDLRPLVGNDPTSVTSNPASRRSSGRGVAGPVLARALRDAVRDGQHGGSGRSHRAGRA